MLTTIGGFDQTNNIPHDSMSLTQSISDPLPKASFTVNDVGSKFSFNFGDEIIIWNEMAPPEPNADIYVKVPATPAHNLAVGIPNSTYWTTSGTNGGLIAASGSNYQMTFSNSPAGTGLINFTTFSGYIHPGQSYMFAVYVTITTPLSNANGILQMQWLDGGQNVLSTISTTFTTTAGNRQQQINISGVAPAGAYYITASFGGQATVGGTNAGVIVFGSPQLEPMYFANTQGVTYPTPDCNAAQADCTLMPDLTVSRSVRFFSGYIEDTIKTYDGPNRTWQISCAGGAALLDSGLINSVYTNQYDSQIITNVINTYFPNQIAINAPNVFSPSPIVQGALISSVSYNDNPLREVLNSLVDYSGFVYFIDPYYRLYYQPAYWSNATFVLTSGTPDNMSSYNAYNYSLETDGSQVKRRIKIHGGKFFGNQQDTFSGNGSTTQFTLTWIPNHVTSLTVGGVAQRVGVYGVHQFSQNKHDVLLNKQSQYILFKNAPASGTNNIVVTYAYEAPVSTTTLLQTSGVVTPTYALPLFDQKVTDTNITDLNTATTRGLAEIMKSGAPFQIIKFNSSQYAPAGTAIFLTNTQDNLSSVPIMVQSVTGVYLGNGINEFQYQCGPYRPTIIDHVRNAHRAHTRSTTVANVTAQQQTDFVATESIGYADSLTPTPQTVYANAAVYGTGKYGSSSYGGSTGTYGGSAQYGVSTIYG